MCGGAGMCTAKGTLDQSCSGIAALCMLEELGRGEEAAKVVKDKFHAPFEVISRPKRECAVIDVKALKNHVGGECL